MAIGAIAITALPPTVLHAASFNVEGVPAGGAGGGLSIALDGGGNPHLVYGAGGDANGSFRHAFKLGGVWHYGMIVDREANYTSLRFNGVALSASFQDVPSTQCWFATFNGFSWSTELVSNLFPVEGLYTSLAFDHLGRPHIAYQELSGADNAIHAFRPAGWIPEDADGFGSSQEQGRYTSIALSPSDSIFISHVGFSAGGLQIRLCELSGSAWQCVNINTALAPVGGTAVAVLPNGRPVVAFVADMGTTRNVLLLGERITPASWSFTPVDTLGDGSKLAMVLDGLGQAHLAYKKGAAIRHAYFDTFEGVLRETVDTDPNPTGLATTLDLAIDGTNTLHLGYTVRVQYPTNQVTVVRYARGTIGSWTIETVDGQYNDGSYLALTTTPSGEPVVAYYEATQGDVKMARRLNVNSWAGDVVAADGNAGRLVCVPPRTVAPNTATMAYFDLSQGTIGRSEGSIDNWLENATIPVGLGIASLSYADSAGLDRIAYYDSLAGDVNLIRLGPNSISVTPVDQVGDVGRSCSIGVTTDGVTHIVYFDATIGRLRHARFVGGAWVFQTIATGSGMGRRSALAARGSELGVAFYDASTGTLHWARWNGSSWATGLVDASADVGSSCSVAMDIASDLSISYYDATNRDLKFARVRDPGTVVDVSLVDGLGDVGSASAIAVDQTNGLAEIIYYDAGLGQMRYAKEVRVGSAGDLSSGDPAEWLRATPNPVRAGGAIQISCALRNPVRGELTLYDVLGRVLYRADRVTLGGDATPYALPLPPRAAGVVFVRAIIESGEARVVRTVAIP